MSQRAGEYAASVRGALLMRDVGVWRLKGVKAPLKLYAISANVKRLKTPHESDKVKLLRPPPLTPRQVWVRRFKRYVMPPLIIYTIYAITGVLAVLEYFGVIAHWGIHDAHVILRQFLRDLF